MQTAPLLSRCIAILVILLCSVLEAAPAATNPSGLFVRVRLQSAEGRSWRVQIVAQQAGGKSKTVFVGKAVGASVKEAELLAAGQATGWVDLSDAVAGGATLRFLFETQPGLEKAGVKAKIDIASGPDEAAILRSIGETDPGNIIAIRIPAHPASDKANILSIREDTKRRLDEVKGWNLPEGPRPKKLWCMVGFRSNGEFYTDPAIAEMDFEIARRLGMNGYWQQGGGQPGALRKMAEANGLNRSTVYWRSVETLPNEKGTVPLKWDGLEQYLDKVYRDSVAGTRKEHPGGMPEIIADLMDEPAGHHFGGPEYAEEFRKYLQQEGVGLAIFGKPTWEEVSPIIFEWRTFFKQRDEQNLKDEPTRRLFYWSAKFWNHTVARIYAGATRKVEQYAPGVGTRVNFGPPWWYDYGTLPRGIDAFEFGRLRSVTLGFNEDWVGKGNRRVPLEINTLLIDWSRAAARPNTPLLGSYITRDADRESVKLRTFACLAREAKIFDFYYYGPAYTFFDHWSDNASMVQGVAELTRDLGAVDDVLWEGRAPKAEVALLYSQSWPVWKLDDTEQNEQVMAYLALLHAGIPVDIVSDTEVSDGRFAARGYKCLYVVNESIPSAAAGEIERWVRSGGKLWASGWAGMKDEYNTPTKSFDEMLGVKSREWKATGETKRLGEPIKPDDWKRPIFGRDTSVVKAEGAQVDNLNSRMEMRAYRHPHGKGLVQFVPWTAGKNYMDGAVEKKGSLTQVTQFPDDMGRKIYSDFSVAAGVKPPSVTSVSQVLAWPLCTQNKGVVLLANFTGEAVAELRVTFATLLPVDKVLSLRKGPLKFTRPDADHIEVTLPLDGVTDILSFE